MENENVNEKILKNCYKNVQMAILSLNDVIPKTNHNELREELLSQRDGYEELLCETSVIMQNYGLELSSVNPMQKTMLSATIGLKTLADDSPSHIAEMVLKGSITGLTALIKDISEFNSRLDSDILNIVEKVKNFEEKCEEQLKKFL